MTQRLTNKDREALLAGDRADELTPDEAAELPLLAALLADRATWAEPSPSLEHDIVRAVVNDQPRPQNVVELHGGRRTRWRTRLIAPAAAAVAVIAIVVGSVVATSGGGSPAFTADLASTGLIPGAHASVEVTHNNGGFRVVLDASDLPRRPDGSYYEAWLKNADGTLVPIGTFSSSDEYVTLWSGVSPAVFTTLTVTVEQADNVQASSGQAVLRGEIRPG
jgi:anti-sigma-K factor RskA